MPSVVCSSIQQRSQAGELVKDMQMKYLPVLGTFFLYIFFPCIYNVEHIWGVLWNVCLVSPVPAPEVRRQMATTTLTTSCFVALCLRFHVSPALASLARDGPPKTLNDHDASRYICVYSLIACVPPQTVGSIGSSSRWPPVAALPAAAKDERLEEEEEGSSTPAAAMAATARRMETMKGMTGVTTRAMRTGRWSLATSAGSFPTRRRRVSRWGTSSGPLAAPTRTPS